ncbi:MAG: hypothetical protein AAF074_14695 [Pseudomonadota bacterium]
MRATRRGVLALGAGAAAAAAGLAPARAHTPYGQWVVYRQKHLLIGCHRRDPEGYATAQATARHLVAHLPASRARVARAPAASRLASLLATAQLDVAVLEPETARAIRAGRDVFAAYGPVEIAMLAWLGDGRALAVHERMPSHHAALLARTLIGSRLAPRAAQAAEPPCPWRTESLALLFEPPG